MTTHTPKLTPPRVYKDPSGNIYRIAVYAEGGRTFHAVTQTDLLNRDWDRALSDAHLIAAASDLLKQLKSARLMLHAWRNTCPDHGELISARANPDDGPHGNANSRPNADTFDATKHRPASVIEGFGIALFR